ncbi:MAG TPA: penicillin-binding protein 2, partial [bacterium]|nr:penicillin-binding protein 2 [bacterium]
MPKYRTVEKSDDVKTAKRVYIVGALFACIFGILASRAVAFHLKDNAQLEKVALRQYRTAVHQSTQRGKILDSAGRELAIDVTVESAWANPREVEDPVTASEKLAKILSVDRRRLLERLSSGRKFVWVKRRLSDEEAEAVKGMDLTGVHFMRESSRSYPGGTLASNILGAVGHDAEPLGGVELAYNDALSVARKQGDVKRDARGHLYLSPMEESSEGGVANVWLTIDRTLQFIAERELGKAVGVSRAKGGSAIVMDVRTGAILAMANLPTFDPNDYGRYSLSNWRNRAIADAYEPGSTFKTVVVAAALDAGVAKPEEIFDCEGGRIKIGSNVVRDAHPHKKLSVADIIKVSSNIGAYKVEQRLGHERAYKSILEFGFGQTSGVDLPGESAGLFSNHRNWSELQFATIAFGQGIAATPIQMINAFTAIANGGTLLKPWTVKRIVDEEGNEIYSGGRQEVARPIGPETSRLMASILRSVTTEGGTGRLAASAEYPMAGKTGTAQKAAPGRGGYVRGKYYSSFVGFAPYDEPRISVYVGIDEPSGGLYYGGQIAAPAFREIAEATLRYLKVPGSMLVANSSVEEQLPPPVARSETAELRSSRRRGTRTDAWFRR